MTQQRIDWRRFTQRVEVPAELGTLPWEWAVPLPYRCIHGAPEALIMPADPETMSSRTVDHERLLDARLAYYTALQSFLTYSFGWSRHDKGLLWWLDEGLPVYDDRLDFLHAIYGVDDHLLGFAAWSSTIAPEQQLRALGAWALRPDGSPLVVPDRWKERFAGALAREPWTGGSDPMHLGDKYHGGGASIPQSDPASARLFDLNAERRTATFVADGISLWYDSLATLGQELPALAHQQHWRVDVFVKPIGFLGSYRRSDVTGLWFAGRHRFHIVGN